MNKGQLIEEITQATELTKAEITRIFDSFTATIKTALQAGDEVAIPGFGTFSVSARAERAGRNPQTGEKITIKASKTVKFKAGKQLKDAVQQ
ncbi:MAG: HU family DNA-binding protein [Gammaproteobacteria bacterium]